MNENNVVREGEFENIVSYYKMFVVYAALESYLRKKKLKLVAKIFQTLRTARK